MKKTLLFLSLSVLLGSCTSGRDGDNFRLTAEGLPTEWRGAYAYILDSSKAVSDSALVTAEGAFVLEGSTNTKALYSLAIGSVRNVVVPELVKQGVGHLVEYEIEPTLMEPDRTTAYRIEWEPIGADVNYALHDFYSELQEHVEPLEKRALHLGYDAIREKDNPERVGEINAERGKLILKVNEERQKVIDRYIKEHFDDALAVVLFREIGYTDEADFVEKYEGASSVVQNDPKYKSQYGVYKLVVETSAGHPYKDFLMDDGEGTQRRLSDYIDGERYLLVDFWASWCGPCRKGMPHLAELHKMYGDRGLRVLSIGVSEQSKADNDKAAEELNIVWDRFYDATGDGAELYGITSIPVVLLIAPDGEILVRSSNPQSVDEVLAERLGV